MIKNQTSSTIISHSLFLCLAKFSVHIMRIFQFLKYFFKKNSSLSFSAFYLFYPSVKELLSEKKKEKVHFPICCTLLEALIPLPQIVPRVKLYKEKLNLVEKREKEKR